MSGTPELAPISTRNTLDTGLLREAFSAKRINKCDSTSVTISQFSLVQNFQRPTSTAECPELEQQPQGSPGQKASREACFSPALLSGNMQKEAFQMTVHSSRTGSFSMDRRKAGKKEEGKEGQEREDPFLLQHSCPGLLLLSLPSNAVPLN